MKEKVFALLAVAASVLLVARPAGAATSDTVAGAVRAELDAVDPPAAADFEGALPDGYLVADAEDVGHYLTTQLGDGTSLRIELADQLGDEGETHGFDVAPARTLDIGPGEDELLARLFVSVSATTVAGALEALRPWLTATSSRP
jgi:hypothetical protein